MSGPLLSLADGMRQLRLTYTQLWTRYLALDGTSTLAELQQHVDGDICPNDHDHNVIAQALNDTYIEQGHDHPVAYRHLYQRNPDDNP
jgi:hypothetical protein